MPKTRTLVSFPLGRIVATPAALIDLTTEQAKALLDRHAAGDWGHLDPEDWEANDRALAVGARLLSAYIDEASGIKRWIITEADRSATTILLPEDY